jgi:hypothetical protein
MICIPTRPASAPAWHAGFLAFLPAIVRQASRAFRHLKPEARHDAVEEVLANAVAAYARLVELGKTDVAYPTPLARFGIRQTKDGRRVGKKRNVRDVSSTHCQQRKGVVLERLDRYDSDEGQWLEILVGDRRAGPAETAVARIDLHDWFGALPARDRKIAAALAVGNSTGEVAEAFVDMIAERVCGDKNHHSGSCGNLGHQGGVRGEEGVVRKRQLRATHRALCAKVVGKVKPREPRQLPQGEAVLQPPAVLNTSARSCPTQANNSRPATHEASAELPNDGDRDLRAHWRKRPVAPILRPNPDRSR